MSIPFIDLKAQQARIADDVDRRMRAVLEHGRYIMGPEIEELEAALAKAAGARHAISCSSGTDALLLPLMAYGVGPGDAVFCPTFTFFATAEVISLLGATPVFVDIDEVTFNLDPASLEQAIERVGVAGELRPRGVIPVDLFGLPAEYDAIHPIADRHGLFVLEDAAQGFGGRYRGADAGSLAETAATSFFPAKPLGCYGDGGAVFTRNGDLACTMNSLRIHGQGADKYDNVRIGLNARLDTLQAAVLLAKLEIFPDEIEARQRVAAAYDEALGDDVVTPRVPDHCRSVWAQYSILTDHRDALHAGLAERGIPTAIYYPRPLHLQTAFADLGYAEGDLPVSERVAGRILSLPMHPYLEAEQIATIAGAVREILAEHT